VSFICQFKFLSMEILQLVRDGFAINLVGWGVAASLETEKFYDLTGSLTFIVLVTTSLARKQGKKLLRNYVNSALVLIWASRLGSFLFARVLRDGKDRRFDNVKTKPRLFLVYWLMQGLWTVITSLPVNIINSKKTDPEKAEAITIRDRFGWALWIAGFLLEVTADRQKTRFRSIAENKGKFITTGVWSWSRHPNYAGEIMLWTGLWISSSSQMRGIDHLSIICPIFNIWLLTRVSGIPLLEKHAEEVWGNDPLYREYVKATPILIPNPFLSTKKIK